MPAWSKMEPLALFRIWARHPKLALALRPLGAFILRDGSVAAEDREIMILRTCACCNAEYEWGVHAVSYPPRLGIPGRVVEATFAESADSAVWSPRQRLLVELADVLHDSADLPDELWARLRCEWSEEELLELVLIAGFYHFVSFTVAATRVDAEPWAARFPERAEGR
jgi:alkylhydroperoxidase family enzyme